MKKTIIYALLSGLLLALLCHGSDAQSTLSMSELISDTDADSKISGYGSNRSTINESKQVKSIPYFNDPMWSKQWNLHNVENPTHDINVLPVWKAGFTGKGVKIALLDDGIWDKHVAIQHAIDTTRAWDFHANEASAFPVDLEKDTHGTRCAGQIVSRPGNGVCGVGVAWDARIVPLRMLSNKIDSVLESKAVTMHLQDIDIYNCSWGPADDGKALDGPSERVTKSFLRGIVEGREGKGAIYVFAAGNGKRGGDNCNADGYANAPFAFTIGAIDHDNNLPPYSEECPSMLAVTYSSNANHKMITTEVGGGCTDKHGGTSAAASIASGIYALILQVRPDLTWRDLQYLTIHSTKRINPEDKSWIRNGAGIWFSNKFGFGSLDAGKMFNLAKKWKLLGRPALISTKSKLVKKVFSRSFLSAFKVKHVNGIKSLEKIAISVNIRVKRRGDVSIWLKSPSGTSNTLMTHRPNDDDEGGWSGWTFSTNAFFGEKGVNGKWILGLQNHGNAEVELISWRLTFFGASIDSGSAWNPEKWARDTLYSIYPPSLEYFEDHRMSVRRGAWIDDEHYQVRSKDDEWAHLSGYFSFDSEIQERQWHRMDGRPDFFLRDQSLILQKEGDDIDTDWLLWGHMIMLMCLLGGKYAIGRIVITKYGNYRKQQSLPL